MASALRIGSIVLRVDDLECQTEFWQAALDYVRHDMDDDFVQLRPRDGVGPSLSLDQVPSTVQLPPRLHLDLFTEDQIGEVERLKGLGATEVHWDKRPPDADYVILADPEGNRFCVVDVSRQSRPLRNLHLGFGIRLVIAHVGSGTSERSRQGGKMIRKLIATTVAMLAVASGVAAAAPSYPATIALPRGFQPEGISIRANTFYVGSIPTGSIYRGNLRTGTGSVFIQRSGRAAIGVEADNRNRLFVAGGPTGKAFVYNARTGADIASYDLAPGFINDVVVTRTGAYFTNSNLAELYRVPIGPGGRLGTTVQKIALKPPYVQGAGFNVNGIDATPNGRWLVIVQSSTGKLFRVNPSTGATVEIALGGADVMRGDGILLDGRTLYVVQNTLNKIAVIRVNSALTTGRVVTHIEDSRFVVPTTIDDLGRRLYAVNARFGSPPATTDYQVIQVRKPNGS